MGLQTHLPVEILDYIQTHEPAEEGYGVSQRELAKALGYHPCSMSRPLGDLVTTGMLAAERGRVRDGKRKQLTYRLTSVGLNRLRERTGDVPLLSGEIPPPPNPFFGRRDELEQLTGLWTEGASVTIVNGPAGMGKTALVSRFLRRSRQRRVPFWYTVRAANSPRQFVTALAHALSFLGKPQLAYYAQLPRPPLARECADLASRALEGRSLSVVVDDFHLVGTDLKGFLAEFIGALGARGSHRFYLVGQGQVEPHFGELPVHQLTVGGLDRDAAYELANRYGGISDRFEKTYDATLGSPLLLKLAVAQREGASVAIDLPAMVLGQLSPDELRAVVPAAVANEPLPTQLLLENRALTPERLKALVTIGILQEGLHGTIDVLQTIRGAVLARIESGEERAAHLRLARFYGGSRSPESVRERFLHLVAGEDWKTAANLLASRERDLLRLGYSDVLRSGIRTLASALPPGPAKVRTYLTEASFLRQHADFNDAILSYRRAISQAPDDARIHLQALLGIVDLELKLGQIDLAEQEFLRAKEIAPGSRSLEALGLLTEARMAEARGDRVEAEAGYEHAFEMGRKIHNQDVEFESISSWSKFAELRSGPDAALRIVQDALPGARQSGRLDLVLNLRLVRARAYADSGRHALAEAEINATRAEAEALGYLTQLTYALSGLAAVVIERGQLGTGAVYAKQACDLAERLGNNIVLGHSLALLCLLECRQATEGGSLQLLNDSVAHGKRSIEVLGRTAPSDSLVYAHAYLAEANLALGSIAEAGKSYEEAIRLANRLGLKAIRDGLASDLGARLLAAREGTAHVPPPAEQAGGATDS